MSRPLRARLARGKTGDSLPHYQQVFLLVFFNQFILREEPVACG